MSEWLTTGEMIDRLEEGEVAEDSKQLMTASWDGGKLKFKIIDGSEYDYITLNDRNLKWRILPRYVNFEEAMKALMNGKTVWLWVNDNKVGYYIDKESGKLWAIVGDCTAQVEKIYFSDKWTIEE
jgi:hypothetical protein